MSSMVTAGPRPPGNPSYSLVNTYTLSTPASQEPIIDTISVLSSSTNSSASTRDVVDLEKDSASISLNQVLLNELQEEGNLTDTLQEQHHLTQHDLNVMALSQVSSNPESLRFQYQPVEELLLQQQPSSSPPPSKRKGSSNKRVYREQDRFVPLHNVARIMRNAIPHNGKVSKDAKECMQECVSECVSFITSEASDKCIAEKRKTITGDDILFAMATLGFDNYIEPLKLYLQKYREFSRADKVSTSPSNQLDVTANVTSDADNLT